MVHTLRNLVLWNLLHTSYALFQIIWRGFKCYKWYCMQVDIALHLASYYVKVDDNGESKLTATLMMWLMGRTDIIVDSISYVLLNALFGILKLVIWSTCILRSFLLCYCRTWNLKDWLTAPWRTIWYLGLCRIL